MKLLKLLPENLTTHIQLAIITRVIFLIALTYTILITAWIGDDAQITFRQVWNFIHGDGILFNFGTRVQAFTHPLWFFVVSVVGFITRELFLTTIVISVLLTLLSVILLMKIEYNSNKENLILISPMFLLIFSWAFLDYSTSGLENPLTNFLIALLFYLVFLSNFKRSLVYIYLVLSMIVLNRFDYAILFSPLAILLIFEAKNSKNFFSAILPGSLLIIAWLIFATFYFGSPLPNTFFAKLNAGYLSEEYYSRGLQYLLSLQLDLITFVVIVVSMPLSIISKNKYLISLSVGNILYLYYIYSIGGDFMQGRFYSTPFFLSICQITVALSNKLNLGSKFPVIISTILFILAIFFGIEKGISPILSGRDYVARPHYGSIYDERGWYYWTSGLFANNRHPFPVIERLPDTSPKRYKSACGVIGGLALVNPETYVIDVCGLTDPFMSRLPAIKINNWRVGHLFRKMPTDYGEYLVGNVSQLPDKNLNFLLADVETVSKKDLWSDGRLSAIWRLNSNYHKDLNFEEYESPDLYIPQSSKIEYVKLENWDQQFQHDKFPPIFGDYTFRTFNNTIEFISETPRLARSIVLGLSFEHGYKIFVNDEKEFDIPQTKRDSFNREIIEFDKPLNVNSIRIESVYANNEIYAAINAIRFIEVLE